VTNEAIKPPAGLTEPAMTAREPRPARERLRGGLSRWRPGGARGSRRARPRSRRTTAPSWPWSG